MNKEMKVLFCSCSAPSGLVFSFSNKNFWKKKSVMYDEEEKEKLGSIIFPVQSTYCNHWNLKNAQREIIQNWWDGIFILIRVAYKSKSKRGPA
jgi:hypothetical protein